MSALKRWGYSGITVEQWLAWVNFAKPLPKKPVLITFDDAYSDLPDTAFPLLEKHGFPATVFVVSSQVGKTNQWDEAAGWGTHQIMTATQLRNAAMHGIEIGAHTRTHPDLRNLDPGIGELELRGCREDLESLLGKDVRSLAYPYGVSDAATRQQSSKIFDACFLLGKGRNYLATDRSALQRTMIQPSDSMLGFWLRVTLGTNPFFHGRRRLHSMMQMVPDREQKSAHSVAD